MERRGIVKYKGEEDRRPVKLAVPFGNSRRDRRKRILRMMSNRILRMISDRV